jgi:hypothetical protein
MELIRVIFASLFVASSTVGCCRQLTTPGSSTITQEIPIPLTNESLLVTLEDGNQVEFEWDRGCTQEYVEPSAWSKKLEQQGYHTDVTQTLQTRAGPAYIVRFRRVPVIGDVTAEPGKYGCQSFHVRLQFQTDGKPHEWHSVLRILPLFKVTVQRFVPANNPFPNDPAFPPGY